MYKLMDQKVKQPIKINLDKDRVYFWCSCGLSKKQAMCDGSHKGKSDKKSQSFRVGGQDNCIAGTGVDGKPCIGGH